jgi:hypothetical protein
MQPRKGTERQLADLMVACKEPDEDIAEFAKLFTVGCHGVLLV